MSLKNRLELERKAQLPHDDRFDEGHQHKQSSLLLVLAFLTAGAYVVGVDIYYRAQYGQAQSAPIYAKSEMTKAEIKALNIVQAKPEKIK